MNIVTVKAYKAGYEVQNYMGTAPTMDGKWTTNDEWTDAFECASPSFTFRLKYVSNYPTSVNEYYLIEFFSDNTNDADDYWQICYEAPTAVGGTPIGGTTPQTDCLRIDFKGHSQTGLTVYKGTGTGWSQTTDYTWPTDIQIVDSIDTSPGHGTPHWIVEIMIEHMHFGIGTPQWIRVAAYDASSGAGVQAWPDTSSVNVPNDWGLSNVLMTIIPESLNIGVMVLLSSVVVIVGSRYFRKGTRIKSCSPAKLEE
jgi:hypothetical protein